MFINLVSSKIRTTITAATRMKWMKKEILHAFFHGSWYSLLATPWHIQYPSITFAFYEGNQKKNIDFIRIVFFFSCVQLCLMKTGEVTAISSSIKWNAFWLVDVHAKQEVITLSLKDIIFPCASCHCRMKNYENGKC